MASFNEQIDLQDIPESETLEYHQLENRYRTSLLVFWGILSFLSLVIIGSLYFLEILDVPKFVVYIVAILLVLRSLISFLKIIFGFKLKGYAIREKDIIYKSGWLWRRMTIAPFIRVQHLRIDQGPIERKLNIARLKIFTAGGSSSDLTIPGLDPNTADRLKAFIVKKTGLDEEE